MSFADDSKLSQKINSIEDPLHLQNCLQKLQEWQQENNMAFNVEKFNLLKLSRNSHIKEEYNYLAPGEDTIISESDVVRDLGILINEEGNYTDHIAKIYTKVTQQAGLLLRTIQNRSPQHMRFIWRTYLEPILDYSSQLCSPTNGGSLIRLESLLESFTAKIDGLRDLSYWERLSRLKLFSLSQRFERYKLLYCNKILNFETQNCGLTWTYHESTGYKFNIPKLGKYYTKERQQLFNYIGPSLYNSLPLYLRNELINTQTWKEHLDFFLEDIPDNPITSKLSSGLSDVITSKPTNSLIKWILHLGLMGRRKGRHPNETY